MRYIAKDVLSPLNHNTDPFVAEQRELPGELQKNKQKSKQEEPDGSRRFRYKNGPNIERHWD